MLTFDHAGPGTVVIKGRLDAAQAAAAQAFLDGVQGTVTLDCSGLEYISSQHCHGAANHDHIVVQRPDLRREELVIQL